MIKTKFITLFLFCLSFALIIQNVFAQRYFQPLVFPRGKSVFEDVLGKFNTYESVTSGTFNSQKKNIEDRKKEIEGLNSWLETDPSQQDVQDIGTLLGRKAIELKEAEQALETFRNQGDAEGTIYDEKRDSDPFRNIDLKNYESFELLKGGEKKTLFICDEIGENPRIEKNVIAFIKKPGSQDKPVPMIEAKGQKPLAGKKGLQKKQMSKDVDKGLYAEKVYFDKVSRKAKCDMQSSYDPILKANGKLRAV